MPSSEEKNGIVKQVEDLINDLVSTLEYGITELSNRGWGNQRKSDTKAGLIRVHGILVPKGFIEYRIFYDHYEILLLQEFTNLARKTLENKKSPIVEFTFRTIWEMGVKLTDVLFAKDLPVESKNYIKLLATLTDLASINQAPWNNYFNKLFEKEKTKLNERHMSLFSEISKQISEGSTGSPTLEENLKKARINLSNEVEETHKMVQQLPIINLIKAKELYSWLSHTLHGNPFLIKSVLNPRLEKQSTYRLFAFLLTSCLNALTRVSDSLGNPTLTKSVKELNSKTDLIWPEFKRYWRESSI